MPRRPTPFGRCSYCPRPAIVRFSRVSRYTSRGHVRSVRVQTSSCAEHEGCVNWSSNRALHPDGATPVMKSTPSLNVNLKLCDCRPPGYPLRPGDLHHSTCASQPINIPCPIPDSFTFEVVLGACPACGTSRPWPHQPECTATDSLKPIRVSCSITSDGTWAGSEVKDVETDPTGTGLCKDTLEWRLSLDACRERWALVKALALGASKVSEFPEPFRMVPAVSEMLGQRNAVFAAISRKARAEAEDHNALREFLGCGLPERFQVEVGKRAPDSLAERMLAAYVEHVVEQVGVSCE